MAKLRHVLCLAPFLIGLGGCMPSATLTLKLGLGYDERGMERVESLLIHNGLCPDVVDTNAKILSRINERETLLSNFYSAELKNFTAVIRLHKPDGFLSVSVHELGVEKFTEPAHRSVNKIVDESKIVFGSGVNVETEVRRGNL